MSLGIFILHQDSYLEKLKESREGVKSGDHVVNGFLFAEDAVFIIWQSLKAIHKNLSRV